jgi:ABC-type branched-subunit amino acid transport system substrate-binding protein
LKEVPRKCLCLVIAENYGQSGIQAFRELAEKANVCIAKEDSVLSNAEDEVFDRVIQKLDEDKNARVVVCFCEGMTVRGLLAATKRLNLTGRFLFLGRCVTDMAVAHCAAVGRVYASI